MDLDPLLIGTQLMGAGEIRRRLGVSKKWADHLVSRADFPRAIASLDAGRVWWGPDVAEWIARHRPHLVENTEAPPLHQGEPGGGTALEERIAARLEGALLDQERAGFEVPEAPRGLASGGPAALVVRLTIATAAQIAAREAER